MPTVKYKRPKVYNYQRKILDSSARYTVTEAATKIGKTASHIIWLLEQALKGKAGHNYWWVAPVYGQAEIAFNRMKRQISNKSFFKANETKLTLTLPSGAVIWFKSAEKPDNLYGDDVYAAVFDEFTRAREEAWTALRSTLTATKGACKFIGNVKGKKNWGYKLAARAKQDTSGTYEHFKITAYDAVAEGLLDIEEINQAKIDLPDSAFQELYLAEAIDDGSNPFGYKHIEKCIKEDSALPPTVFGIDLAKSVDFTVIIGLDQNRHVCYFKRFQKDWKQTKEIIRTLPSDVPIKIDSTGVGDPIVEELQEHFHLMDGVKFTSQSKQQLMEGLAASIQQNKVGFPAGVIEDELKNFEFEYTRTGVRYTAPQGFHDDCVCALALADSGWSNSQARGKYTIL